MKQSQQHTNNKQTNKQNNQADSTGRIRADAPGGWMHAFPLAAAVMPMQPAGPPPLHLQQLGSIAASSAAPAVEEVVESPEEDPDNMAVAAATEQWWRAEEGDEEPFMSDFAPQTPEQWLQYAPEAAAAEEASDVAAAVDVAVAETAAADEAAAAEEAPDVPVHVDSAAYDGASPPDEAAAAADSEDQLSAFIDAQVTAAAATPNPITDCNR
jgi:hypothetical protein